MYSALHDTAAWTLHQVLAEQAGRKADATWITMVDGESISFGEAYEDARRVAGFVSGLGIQAGDRVAVLVSSSIDFVRVWTGLSYLGATAVLLNTELRGAFLLHQLDNCAANLAIVDSSLLSAVEELSAELKSLRRVIVVGACSSNGSSLLTYMPWSEWQTAAPHVGKSPLPQHIACVMYTSGTSGPAKGVLMPHAHCYLYGLGAIESLALQAEDRYYIVLPLFHANGLLMQLGATLIAGIQAVVRPRFSASSWLGDVRRYGATVTSNLGVLGAFIIAQPPTPDDHDHQLRAILNVPNFPAHEAIFRERFGIRDVLSAYGMTEVNIPLWGRIGHSKPGAAGWVYSRHFELIIANPETDQPLPAGSVGEILVRPKTPWGFMAGYLDMPEKTVDAWRNLWFHTGDAGTMNPDNVVTFVDRIKDCIRRRGENISATEVEAVVENLLGVAEVAAFAVPSTLPGGEDEIMLAIVPKDGQIVDIGALLPEVDKRLPRFARPRYIELVNDLPKTATGKVQRALLRKRGAGLAWDRDS